MKPSAEPRALDLRHFVVLAITAQQGAGLLGDLLYTLANLHNNNGRLNAIANLIH